jgi:predicted permease
MAFVQIAGCLLLGLVLQRQASLSRWLLPVCVQAVLWVCLPALALLRLPTLNLRPQLLLPVLLIWLCFGGAVLWSGLWPHNRATRVCLILTCGLGNTSFVGLPLLQALIGPPALPPALLLDQAGSFLITGTLGLALVAWGRGENLPPRRMLHKLLTFPPFIAFAVGLLLAICERPLSGLAARIASGLAAGLAPLALLSVGLQLQLRPQPELRPLLLIGLSYKLLLAPLGVLLLGLSLKLPPLWLKVCVLEAAMGPMITSSLLVIAAGLRTDLATRLVGIGIPLSLLTVPLWHLLLQGLG